LELKILNSAMLNVTLIKTGKLQVNQNLWEKPGKFLKNFCKLFQQKLSQNRIKLDIEEGLSGEP